MTSPAAAPNDNPPIVSCIARAVVVIGAIGGPAWLGWSLGGGRAISVIWAILLALPAVLLWFGTWSPDDPESGRLRIVALPGRLRLALEAALILFAGAAFWIGWHRAAGETFLTLCVIVYAVSYPRLAALWRG